MNTHRLSALLLPVLFASFSGCGGQDPQAVDPELEQNALILLQQAENTDVEGYLFDRAALALAVAAPETGAPVDFGKVRTSAPPCGDDVRPYIITERPFLGDQLQIHYWLAGLPLNDPGNLSAGFIAVGIGDAPSEPRLKLPPHGCPIYPNIGDVLLWVVRPGDELDGSTGVWHEPWNRRAILSTHVPDVPQVHGQKIHTQLATYNEDTGNWRTSQLVEITFGRAYVVD